MRTGRFDQVTTVMEPMQRETVRKLAEMHSDLKWHAGSMREKRVSVWKNGNSIAAINVRSEKYFLKMEFREKDYSGERTIPTKHRNFDRAFNFSREEDLYLASDILSEIEQRYS